MYVPANANTNDIKAFCIGDAFGINIIATTIPSCAESIVAPVVGDTNLFLLICFQFVNIIPKQEKNPCPTAVLLRRTKGSFSSLLYIALFSTFFVNFLKN